MNIFMMSTNTLLVYSTAVLLTLYGLRSLIAGFKNEKRNYWVNLGWDDSKKLFKEKYDKVNNIIWGAISFASGIFILIWY